MANGVVFSVAATTISVAKTGKVAFLVSNNLILITRSPSLTGSSSFVLDEVIQIVIPSRLGLREINDCPIIVSVFSLPTVSELNSCDASGSLKLTHPTKLNERIMKMRIKIDDFTRNGLKVGGIPYVLSGGIICICQM